MHRRVHIGGIALQQFPGDADGVRFATDLCIDLDEFALGRRARDLFGGGFELLGGGEQAFAAKIPHRRADRATASLCDSVTSPGAVGGAHEASTMSNPTIMAASLTKRRILTGIEAHANAKRRTPIN